MTSPWNTQLEKKLIAEYGKKTALVLVEKYAHAFPAIYYDEYPVEAAVLDIQHLEQISDKRPLHLGFYISPKPDEEHLLHLRLYQWQQAIALSDILPILENLGLRINNESLFKITAQQQPPIWISDFAVVYQTKFAIDQIAVIFQDAFNHIYFGLAENDSFNKLVLSASLSWREISILRAYAKYLRQIGFRFSQAYIEKTVNTHAMIAKDLIALFFSQHDPMKKTNGKESQAHIEQQIVKALESVSSLDEDRILRTILELIKATLRTNYFQLKTDGTSKDYLSFKLRSAAISDLPLPIPLYEIFVYSPRFEAIHLRNTKVARGGIRWSDRLEDFRTEILGLMKAQTVKNAIIVPSGAKGGFVLKKSPLASHALQTEVIECYQSFIRGLLDITDNLIEKKVIHPVNVVCHDDADPYLVVAADKGTASFSDIANAISKEYHFWLDDAFASGGATGYDHKKMGITARGAWESIKRHFRELEVDVNKAIMTVVGIGDMSGDVFGNGMLYSDRIKLIGAFDHRHIFIDPDPNPKTSYVERERLFKLPRSSWADYQTKLISKGGGVFSRSEKSIKLSPQIKMLLGVNIDALPPHELIRAMLKTPVDLLFNGGIGTYVKASTQTNADVGDRTNDYCRVNGNELMCKVVGEGGNLGFTQLGRVEYALKGGLINTDFIDNSAGVDCSDHEVNLKILLDQEVHQKKLSLAKRNDLLVSVTQEVADLVLHDNYQQALVMSFSAFHAKKNIGLHQSYIKELQTLKVLNRKVEFLPDDKTLLERKAAEEGLTRPELAVLLAYTKIYIQHEILKSDLFDDAYLCQIVETAFPFSIRKKYQQAMRTHRLHRNIIATQLSNKVVNAMGITFVYRLQTETGAAIADIIRAYVAAAHIFESDALQKVIESLDFKIPLAEQYGMLFNVRSLLNLATRWLLRHRPPQDDLPTVIKHFSAQVKTLENIIPTLMAGISKNYLDSLTEKFAKISISKDIAKRIGTYRAIYTSLNIIDIASTHQFDLMQTAKIYFAAGERLNLLWFRDQIAQDARDGHWNVLARLTLRDELDIAQCALTVAVMHHDKKETDATTLFDHWMTDNHVMLERWNKLLSSLHESANIEYSMFFIALRELLNLLATTPSRA